jgi:hypothetical protein
VRDLPEALDRYHAASPYDTLGVSPDATAAEVRDRHNELQRQLQEASMSQSERAKETQRLEAAYNQLRVPANRMRIDFFVLDPQLGRKQCEAAARALAKPSTEVQGLLKPRTFRVGPAALLGELEAFVQEPPKVVGLHPQPMPLPEPDLPEPLAIHFEC